MGRLVLTGRGEQRHEDVQEDHNRRDRPRIVKDEPEGVRALELVVVVKVWGSENRLQKRVDDGVGCVALLVRNVETRQRLAEADGEDRQQDTEDRRFLQMERVSVRIFRSSLHRLTFSMRQTTICMTPKKRNRSKTVRTLAQTRGAAIESHSARVSHVEVSRGRSLKWMEAGQAHGMQVLGTVPASRRRVCSGRDSGSCKCLFSVSHTPRCEVYKEPDVHECYERQRIDHPVDDLPDGNCRIDADLVDLRAGDFS